MQQNRDFLCTRRHNLKHILTVTKLSMDLVISRLTRLFSRYIKVFVAKLEFDTQHTQSRRDLIQVVV